MQCDETTRLMSEKIDGELDENRSRLLQEHLANCEKCRAQFEKWQYLGKELEQMNISGRHDRRMDRFESHVFARVERGVVWILLSISAVLLSGAGVFYLFRDFLFNPEVPTLVRLGVAAGALGLVVLAVSTLRHRIVTYKSDKYRGVQR